MGVKNHDFAMDFAAILRLPRDEWLKSLAENLEVLGDARLQQQE